MIELYGMAKVQALKNDFMERKLLQLAGTEDQTYGDGRESGKQTPQDLGTRAGLGAHGSQSLAGERKGPSELL